MNKPDWIYLNAFCRTHDGRKAKIILLDPAAEHPVVAIVYSSDRDRQAIFYSTSGEPDSLDEDLTLIGPWFDKPRGSRSNRVYLWEYRLPNGEWILDTTWRAKFFDYGYQVRKSSLAPNGIQDDKEE